VKYFQDCVEGIRCNPWAEVWVVDRPRLRRLDDLGGGICIRPV